MIDERRQTICATARRWVGTPFALNTWTRGGGASCVGLIVGVGREAGVLGFDPDDPDIAAQLMGGPMPHPVALFRALDRFAMRTRDARPGDILLFRRSGLAQHLGLLLPRDRFVASEGPRPARGVIETALPANWAADVAGTWAYRGLADG